MEYNFDEVIDRSGTCSVKWDNAEQFFKAKYILPMWVADMDFRSPQPVIDALKAVAERGIYGYTGAPDSYYESIAGWMKRRHGWDIKREWVAPATGVVPAIRLLVKAFTRPGDKVIVQKPVYYPFFDAIRDNGCEIVDNPLRLAGEQYVMDFEDLQEKARQGARMLILCSPHNPISRVWKAEELKALGDICLRHNILVISDEIHHDLVYRDYKHVCFHTVSEAFIEQSIVCTAGSKTFNLPGLRTSNIIIPNIEMKLRFQQIMRGSGMSAPNMFGLAATEAAYRYGDEWLDQLIDYLQGNIDYLKEFIKERIPGLNLIQPQGTYLLWLDFRGCGIKPELLGGFIRDVAKVGTEAGMMFGADAGFERMNIACPRSLLAEALRRIEAAVKAHK